MDSKNISDFHKKANKIMSLLEQVNTTYNAVLIYENSILVDRVTNNFNDWATVFFISQRKDNSVLLQIVEILSAIPKGKAQIMIWDDVLKDADNKNRKLRREYGIYNGISLIIKCTDEIAYCIATSTCETSDGNSFHKQIMSLENKFISILSEE